MSDVKSLNCPQGSQSTQNGLYCTAGTEIVHPQKYAGERAGSCGSGASSAKGVLGFVIDGGQMECIRDGLAAKGISLPKDYFYFDELSNIEGYTCYNTTNVATNIAIVESGMDVVEDCVGDKEKAEAFKKFVDLHTPPETHGMGDWFGLVAVFGLAAPALHMVLQHFYNKFLNGHRGPPTPPTQPGGSAPSARPAPSSSGEPMQFSGPEEGFSDMYNPIPAFEPLPQSMMPDSGFFPVTNPWPQSVMPEISPAPATSPSVSSSPSISIRPPTETEAAGIGVLLAGTVLGAILMYFCPTLMLQTSTSSGVMMSPGGAGFLQGGDSYGGLGPSA